MNALPIESILPSLQEALKTHGSAVLIAEPGAGKTTRVPLALLEQDWLAGRRILMLEPRRIAARSAARFMASSRNETVGGTIGFRVRQESRVGKDTRIEVITEGILTRMLQEDPALEGVGLVIFDEFHERSLHADLGLALCLQSKALFREDLRLLVMSATLEAEPVAAMLDGAPVIRSEGRSFPVETRYLPKKPDGRIEPAVVRTILDALERETGDILVFLPGAAEIRRVDSMLRSEPRLGKNTKIAPLYGNLSQEEQDIAIAPGVPSERKIVLATSIAETSLTVEGVRTVIDSGRMRVPRFSPRSGMTRLETVTVSRSSADQRRGRAGRLGPGCCYRLWTEEEDKRLASRGTPEILEADLAPLVSELSLWGVSEPEELSWLDPPPRGAYLQARELLARLGALDKQGNLTAHGKEMAALSAHPRLAHMILRAIPHGWGRLACELAALLGERDIFRGEASHDADLRLRAEALHRDAPHTAGGADAADRGAVKRVQTQAAQWMQAAGIGTDPHGDTRVDTEHCGVLLGFAYPDRIGKQRGNGRFLLSGGRGAYLPGTQPLSGAGYLAAAELADETEESRIYLAAPLEAEALIHYFGDQIETETEIYWDRGAKAVRARKREKLGALVLKEMPFQDPDPDRTLQAMLEGIKEEGLEVLPWTKAARQLQQRMMYMHKTTPDWPDVSDEALTADLTDWLGPHVYGKKRLDELGRLNLTSLLEERLSWNQRRELDEQVPTHLTVPSGSRIPIDYSDPQSPALAVRLQEMFGLAETPRIAHGKVPITIHLLSPANRPVQVTRDLASFWQHAYFDVKKDLKGRYPKHYWPDDPLEAAPTNRAKPRPRPS